MFVRIGSRVLNTDAIVQATIIEALPEREDEETGETLRAIPLRVDVITTASTSTYDDGGDFPEFKHTDYHPYCITLWAEDAEKFLTALPVYEPVIGDES